MLRLWLGAATATLLTVGAACSSPNDGAPAAGADPAAIPPARVSADGGPETSPRDAAGGVTDASADGPRVSCAGTDGAAIGSWSSFGGGQCLVGIQGFYPAMFGASIPTAREAQTGACAPEGACHVWLDDIPTAALWERIPDDGTSLPSTYDVIVYEPFAGNPYGHIAAVDRIEAGKIYVMDTNYDEDEQRAAVPHTTSLKAYGWYHLRKLPKTSWCSSVPLPPAIASQPCAGGAGFYCGGDHLDGNPDVLYACDANRVYVARECGSACKVLPAGQQDRCD